MEAVKAVGFSGHQMKEIAGDFFADAPEWKEMFFRRYEELKKAAGGL